MAFTAPITICSTARLVRGMRLQQQLREVAAGNTLWTAVQAYTLSQWLDETIGHAILLGEIASDALPNMRLHEVAAAHLWQEAISECLAKHEAAALFDIRALADAAMEAHQLMTDWQISEEEINQQFMTQETRQFLRWRNTFLSLCSRQQAIDAVTLRAKQIDLLQQHALPLPARIDLAGFDRMTPLEQRLFDYLTAQSVEIHFLQLHEAASHVTTLGLSDSNAECRAAVAWAKQRLAENPQAQLAIISPVLGSIRRELTDLLDDAFYPEALNPAQYEMPRCYDFSLGLALKEYPLVHSALRLLHVAVSHEAMGFEEVTPWLLDSYWGELQELDSRAMLDAHLRQRMSATYGLEALQHQAAYLLNEDVQLIALQTHLTIILQFRADAAKRQRPSAWMQAFNDLLTQLNWAGTRELSSHEYQVQQSFQKRLIELSTLDGLLGSIPAREALRKLNELCSHAMFQPEAVGDTHIQLLGLLETPALQLDGIWALNMNDQHWPPPVRLNPLLPAELQRERGVPNASASIQQRFASLVQQRLLKSAPEIVFSYALKEDDRELRPSPLLLPAEQVEVPTMQTAAEQQAVPAKLELLEDHIGPAVTYRIRGGVKLFATQAICPAWAFYQYRLGAKKLETPVDGLDSQARGSLLHHVLQCFWQECESLPRLQAMSPAALQQAIEQAITQAVDALSHELEYVLPPQVLQIERERLQLLMQHWLALEAERADFSVLACEKEFKIDIEGFPLNLKIDRIDQLSSGGLVVIDYKTGSAVDSKTWADDRIAEPQLPIYAALALQDDQVVAVSFAKVRSDETRFIGIADDDTILPAVTALSQVRDRSPFKRFEHWETLIQHWRDSLTAIAHEIQSGVASVTFQQESDLEYCDVKPLLRLPERQLQFEHAQIDTTNQTLSHKAPHAS